MVYKIETDNGEIFSYSIDRSPHTLIGYSMYTAQITSPIIPPLKLITKEIIDEIYLMSDDFRALADCSLSKEQLVGKYFDRDGSIYYTVENQIYQFTIRLKYFEKLYRNDRKGKITYKHESASLCIVEFDEGSFAAIDIDTKEILLESGDNIDFFWDVVSRRESTRGWFMKKLKEPIPFSGLEEYKHNKAYNICNP